MKSTNFFDLSHIHTHSQPVAVNLGPHKENLKKITHLRTIFGDIWENTFSSSLLLVWHAPLGVRSAKRRHQSPEWTILSHSYRLIQ